MNISTHEIPGNWTPLPRYIFRKKNILSEVRKHKDVETFLDFGCGAGDLACSLAEHGVRGRAFDFSESAIAVSNAIKKQKGLNDKQIKFTQSQTDISEMKKGADLVMSLEVLEHIEDDKPVFNELVRLADKLIIISVPAKRRLFSASDELAGHYRRYDYSDLKTLIKHPDVKKAKIVAYGYPFTNVIRLLREFLSKKETAKEDKLEERSKQSGINIFEVNPNLSKLHLETILTPFYHISRLFNRSHLSEGWLVILEKK